MKIIKNIFSLIGVLVVIIFVRGALSDGSQSSYEKVATKNNFDGTYNIDFGNSKCGNLGYQFKVNFETVFDETENAGRIYKSNCKLVGGRYQGYIYPSNKPNIRIFWQESHNGKAVLVQ